MSSDFRVYRKLLQMVAVLHSRGHELLRVLPYMSPSGAYWRCEIGPGSSESGSGRGVGYPRARYSSSSGAEYYDWGDCSDWTVEAMADRFEQSFAETLEKSRGRDAEYVQWFADMLAQTGPGGLIYAFADWETDRSVMNVLGECSVESVPLPPEVTPSP